MDDQFVTSFSLGQIAYLFGWLLLAIALYFLAVQLRSILLRLSALALLICAFSALSSELMPTQFGQIDAHGQAHFAVWSPHWVSWLALVGAPLAVLLAGVSACVYVFLRSRANRT